MKGRRSRLPAAPLEPSVVRIATRTTSFQEGSSVSQLQPVRGTHDLLPDEMRRYRQVAEAARFAAECHGYLEVATPIFEFSEVFKRTLGDTSDIVTKEMYTFT